MPKEPAVAVPIPNEWDDLTDDAKDRVVAEVLKRLADATGVHRRSDEVVENGP